MACFIGKFILLVLLVLPTTLMITGNGPSSGMMVSAQQDDIIEEDIIEGEGDDEDATVETGEDLGEGAQAVMEDGEANTEEEEEEKPLKASPDADTFLLFTKPNTQDDNSTELALPTDLPAGEQVKFLVGFANKGESDFFVDSMEASFRYPQDYTFFIQNFTTARYNRIVEPNREATFSYSFTPSETFNARPFGLTINLNYRDAEGTFFQDAVFNETVQVVEPDEGLDGETFFLYVFLAAVAVLLLVGAQQLLASFGKRRMSSKPSRPAVEMGTQNKGDVDLDWIPEETLQKLNRSPGRSPKQSPRQRRSKRRSAGATDE